MPVYIYADHLHLFAWTHDLCLHILLFRLACSSHKASQEHMIKRGKLASGLGCLRTILAEPAKFIPRHFIRKSGHNLKKVHKLGIQKVIFFVHRIEWDRSKIYKIYKSSTTLVCWQEMSVHVQKEKVGFTYQKVAETMFYCCRMNLVEATARVASTQQCRPMTPALCTTLARPWPMTRVVDVW